MNTLRASAVMIVTIGILLARSASGAAVSREDVNSLVKPVVEQGWCGGLVVGVIDPEHGPRIFAYGHRGDDNKSSAPDGDTLFEVGSISKAFNGDLLADMVIRKEVALDDPIQKYLPADVNMPQAGPRPITLADLATHSSGLPRLPDNFRPKDADNPYADYTVEQMYAFLKTWKPARPPGEKFEYSNLGMGLLGHALARHAGKPYDELLSERVLRPLGMRNTRLALGRPQDKLPVNFARGHDADGNPVKSWDFPTLAAAGAVQSTANDMLKFAGAQMDDASPLAGAAKLARTPIHPAPPGNQIGLGWHIRDGKDHIVWHNGMTGGYHAYCGYVPDRKIAVVVLGNSVTGAVDAIGVRLLDRMLGKELKPIPLPEIKTLSAAALDACAGRYVLLTGMTLTVTRDGDRMFCQASGQARYRIYPESETSFFYKVVNAKLSFKLDKAGRAHAVTLEQDVATIPGLRATSEPTTTTTTRPAK